jgi:choline-sulfatase
MLGELLAGLERRGLMDGTLVALTADHGESLGEHRYYFHHGRFGFETCLHVPLLLRWPGRIRPGRDAAPAELVDLAPTLLDLAGVPLEGGAWMQGRSLVPRLTGRERAPGYARAEAGYATDGRWQKVIRDGRYKLIFAPYLADQRHIGGRGQPYALFDLTADPGETENLVESRPQEFARLHDALFEWWQPNSFPVLVDDETGTLPALTEETREQLEALGYLGN